MGFWWQNTVAKRHNMGKVIKFCPNCQKETNWTAFRIEHEDKCWGCIPCGTSDQGEFIQCNTCGAQYATKQAKSSCC